MQTTIWLPGDLRDRVRAANLNMSQLCSAALQAELDRRAVEEAAEKMDEPESLERIAARLRLSRNTEYCELVDFGRQMGREWAAAKATWSELREMEAEGPDWKPGDEYLISQFNDWQTESSLAGLPWADDAVIEGFIQGAMSVWSKVRDRVEAAS